MKSLESDAFVFFGATGDLAYEQIFPALHAMTRRGHFEIPIIGVGRSAKDLEALRARAHESIEKHGGVDQRAFSALSAKLQYVKGDYSSPETFRELRKELGAASRPLYYLAIPPDLSLIHIYVRFDVGPKRHFDDVIDTFASQGSHARSQFLIADKHFVGAGALCGSFVRRRPHGSDHSRSREARELNCANTHRTSRSLD